MIRFFRGIRQSLLAQGRLKRYLVYAIGEIVLVVIGILIAVNINDWNADRKQQREIQQLLSAFEKDLAANIKECTTVLDWVAARDSICELILRGRVTREMYEAKTVGPMFTTYRMASTSKENLERLLSKEELMGPGSRALLELLKSYKTQIEREAVVAERFREYVYDQNMYMVDHATWYSTYRDSGSAEAMDYFLNDPIYRNKTGFYHTLMTHNFGRQLAIRRRTELALYHKLMEMQGRASQEQVQAEFREFGLVPLEALDCSTQVDLDDHRTKAFTPFILNTGSDTLNVLVRYIKERDVQADSTTIAPGGHLAVMSSLNHHYLELSRNGRCIGRYLPDAKGYAILGNTE